MWVGTYSFLFSFQMEEQPTFTHPDLHSEPSAVGHNLLQSTDQKPFSDVLPSAHEVPIGAPAYTQELEPEPLTASPLPPSQSVSTSNGSAPVPSLEKVELPPVVQKDEPSLSHQIQKDLKRKLLTSLSMGELENFSTGKGASGCAKGKARLVLLSRFGKSRAVTLYDSRRLYALAWQKRRLKKPILGMETGYVSEISVICFPN